MKKTERGFGDKSLVRRRFLAASCYLGPAVALARPALEEQEHSEFSLTTDDRIALALMRFGMGFHCSQSVLEAYADDFGLDPELTRPLSAALAGGSTVGGECGAVGAGYLVLGLRFGKSLPAYGNVEREAELWKRVRQFVARFREEHGTINCRDLLGVDVFTSQGREEALQNNLFATCCPKYIRSSITILDSL